MDSWYACVLVVLGVVALGLLAFVWPLVLAGLTFV